MSEIDIYKFIVIPSIASIVVVLGWFVANLLSKKRDSNNKAREMRVEYLISAYRVLFRVGVDQTISKNAKECENAIADIQLLGTLEQIKLAQEYINNISQHGSADLMGLIKVLRNDLRKELNLEKASETMSFLKIEVFDKKA